jgi:hypothetical protein
MDWLTPAQSMLRTADRLRSWKSVPETPTLVARRQRLRHLALGDLVKAHDNQHAEPEQDPGKAATRDRRTRRTCGRPSSLRGVTSRTDRGRL